MSLISNNQRIINNTTGASTAIISCDIVFHNTAVQSAVAGSTSHSSAYSHAIFYDTILKGASVNTSPRSFATTITNCESNKYRIKSTTRYNGRSERALNIRKRYAPTCSDTIYDGRRFTMGAAYSQCLADRIYRRVRPWLHKNRVAIRRSVNRRLDRRLGGRCSGP